MAMSSGRNTKESVGGIKKGPRKIVTNLTVGGHDRSETCFPSACEP